MNKKDKNRERAFTIFFMFAITFVFISAVSLVYIVTKDTIKINESLQLKTAVLNCAGIGFPPKTESVQIEKKYNETVKVLKENKLFEVKNPDGGNPGYVLVNSGPGLWGEITAVIGLKDDLKTLTGIEFIKQNETPGLGARITEPWFMNQFKDKQGPFEKMVPEKEPAKNQEFQAITGATITSTAVQSIINKTIKTAQEEIEKK